MKKEDLFAITYGTVIFLLIYLGLLYAQHISGACDKLGGDFWAGGCHKYLDNSNQYQDR